MEAICQIAGEVIEIRQLIFSLQGLMWLLGIVGAYVYVSPVRTLVQRFIGLLTSLLGFIGTALITLLLTYYNLYCV